MRFRLFVPVIKPVKRCPDRKVYSKLRHFTTTPRQGEGVKEKRKERPCTEKGHTWGPGTTPYGEDYCFCLLFLTAAL